MRQQSHSSAPLYFFQSYAGIPFHSKVMLDPTLIFGLTWPGINKAIGGNLMSLIYGRTTVP